MLVESKDMGNALALKATSTSPGLRYYGQKGRKGRPHLQEVSEKLPKTISETSDSRDYKRLQRFVSPIFNRCNLFNNLCNQRALWIFRLFQSSLQAKGLLG